jgi:tripartite-type tricarboxylate transporter receptor subunit TctC
MIYTIMVVILLIALFGGPISSEVKALEYPVRPINIIVPWPPGSSNDLIPRAMAPYLSMKFGVPLNVVNKPGGAGIVGTLEAVKAPPDGYTVLDDSPGSSSIQLAWSQNLPYKVEERTFIARAVRLPMFVVVPINSPWKTMEDIAQAIRKDPANFRWSGIGGTAGPDVVLAQFRAALVSKGIDLSKTKTVQYQGTGFVMTALGGGHVDIAFATYASCRAMVEAGKARVIAVTGPERYKGFPYVPTAKEEGYPSVSLTFWVGYSGPPGLPGSIVQTWVDAIEAVLNEPELLKKLNILGAVPTFLAKDHFRKFVMDEAAEIKAASGK